MKSWVNPGLGWARPGFRLLGLGSKCPSWVSRFQVTGSGFKVPSSRADFHAPGTLLGRGPILDPFFWEHVAKSHSNTILKIIMGAGMHVLEIALPVQKNFHA